MKNLKSQNIIQCLEDIRSGKYDLNECLLLHPQLSQDLPSLLDITQQIAIPENLVSDEFRQRARRRLFREMDKSPNSFRDYFGGWIARINPVHSLRALAVVVPVCLILIFSGVLYASMGSLPGESLYRLKTGVEGVNLAVTLDPAKKADLRLNLVERRVNEIISLNSQGRPLTPQGLDSLVNSLDQALNHTPVAGSAANPVYLENLTKISLTQNQRLAEIIDKDDQLQSTDLYQAYQVTRRSLDLAIIAKSNPTVLQSRISLTQTSLDTNNFTLSGKLQDIQGDDWTIGGVVLKDVHIAAGETPPAGSLVEVKGVQLEQGAFITKMSEVEMPSDQVTLKGTFLNSEQDGQKWEISGLKIDAPAGLNSPQPGQNLEIEGHLSPDSASVEWQGKSETDDSDLNKLDALPESPIVQFSLERETGGTNAVLPTNSSLTEKPNGSGSGEHDNNITTAVGSTVTGPKQAENDSEKRGGSAENSTRPSEDAAPVIEQPQNNTENNSPGINAQPKTSNELTVAREDLKAIVPGVKAEEVKPEAVKPVILTGKTEVQVTKTVENVQNAKVKVPTVVENNQKTVPQPTKPEVHNEKPVTLTEEPATQGEKPEVHNEKPDIAG